MEQIGVQAQITSFTDGSVEGAACGVIYQSVIDATFRMSTWDFATKELALTASGSTPPTPWEFEYLYPSDAVQIKQIRTNFVGFTFNVQPIRWAVASNLTPTKVIWCDTANAVAVYTFRSPESEWDTMFIETAVKMVASKLAMALAGRPDYAKELLDEAMQMATMAESRQY